MQIFTVSSNVQECAEVLDDRRLIKAILETAVLVSNGLHHCHPTLYRIRFQLGKAYKLGYSHHPCINWVKQNTKNYYWIIKLGLAYCNEYTLRFGKVHASECVFTDLAIPKIDDPTEFYDGAGYHSGHVFSDYKELLCEKWKTDKYTPRWTNQVEPFWAWEL